MPYIKLIDKDGKVIKEESNFRLENAGRINLPRNFEEDGKLYRFLEKEGQVNIYKEV